VEEEAKNIHHKIKPTNIEKIIHQGWVKETPTRIETNIAIPSILPALQPTSIALLLPS
jgi:hypothetical protein